MSKRVLLCDDEIHILRAVELKLRHAGYEVRIAGDGEEGWTTLQTWRPDVLITDYQMPRLDGLGLIARIRQTPELAGLPVFLLTAKGFELDHEDMVAQWHILAIIGKPFSPRELVRRVESILVPA